MITNNSVETNLMCFRSYNFISRIKKIQNLNKVLTPFSQFDTCFFVHTRQYPGRHWDLITCNYNIFYCRTQHKSISVENNKNPIKPLSL